MFDRDLACHQLYVTIMPSVIPLKNICFVTILSQVQAMPGLSSQRPERPLPQDREQEWGHYGFPSSLFTGDYEEILERLQFHCLKHTERHRFLQEPHWIRRLPQKSYSLAPGKRSGSNS